MNPSSTSLRQRREEILFETLQQLADRAGISISTVQRCEKGIRPKPALIPKIAAVYKLDPQDFLRLLRQATVPAAEPNAAPAVEARKDGAA